ncbi:hypothetical protein TIFTF001_050905, partial [Ficus carica]
MSKHLALLTWLARALTTRHLRPAITGRRQLMLLALLDQAWFNTSWPAITRERHLMLLALMSQPLDLLTWPSRARMAGHHSRRQDQIGFFQGLRSNGCIFR